jgi:flagellar motility protein MotE (MotC chaperone)
MKNFIALLLFLGAFAGWYLHNEKKQTAESLQESLQQLAEAEKTITNQRSEFQRYSTVGALKQQIAGKQAEFKEVNDKLKSLRDQTEAVVKDQQKQRGIIRQAQVGKSINLTLVSGRIFGQVRIMKVDDTGISVANATGIVKVPLTELPPDLKRMFLF